MRSHFAHDARSGGRPAGVLPAHVRARASYGPEVHAQAAYLACGHYLPVSRVAVLLCQLAGIAVSASWVAGIRGKAAALIGASGWANRTSGGCWRTLRGLAEFAIVHSYLSTAAFSGGAKWDISKLGALRDLFDGHPWIPPAAEPGG